MAKLSKRSQLIKNSGLEIDEDGDYIDPREDPSHPGYEAAHERDADVYREFLKSQPKKKGKELSICPKCFKSFKAEEVNINPFSEWAFKDGVTTIKTSKGCPNCDPENYDESKDPFSESAIAKQKEEIEKEREEKREKDRLWWKKFNKDKERNDKFFEEYYKKHPELKPEEKEVAKVEEEYEYWADDADTVDQSGKNSDDVNYVIDDKFLKLKISNQLRSILNGISVLKPLHLFERLVERANPEDLDIIFKSLKHLAKRLREKNPPNKGSWFWDTTKGQFFGKGTSLETFISKDMVDSLTQEEKEQNFKLAAIQEQDNLGARLKEEELLEKKDFDPADITLVQHLKDSLKTLINSSQHLFELNILTEEELNVIKTIEENMDDYLIAEQWNKMAKLKVFLKTINSNIRNRTISKLGQLRNKS